MGHYSIRNDQVEVAFDEAGNLVALTNLKTGHNYAGSRPIWRLCYQERNNLDLEVLAPDCTPAIARTDNRITMRYESVRAAGRTLCFTVTIEVTLAGDEVHWAIELTNREPDMILRECQFPLIGDCVLDESQALLWSKWGGQRFPDPRKEMERERKMYYLPDYHFRQMTITYPGQTAATNCYLFANDKEGLYVGCHDDSFSNTLHSIRLYGEGIEAGLAKYPSLKQGGTWRQDGYVTSPYTGDWHVAARKYRAWADTWFRQREQPEWVKLMTGWQRVILKHQYGEVHYRYDQLPQIYRDGAKAGIETFNMFGWWLGGHDNNYPNYVPDPDLGSEEELRQGVRDFVALGGKVIFYSSGRLIDKATEFYETTGHHISIKDHLGMERQDAYRYRGYGSFAGEYANRTFVVACPSQEEWYRVLQHVADLAFDYGCQSVFYDQLGSNEYPCCDESHGHSVPFMTICLAKAELLKRLRAYVKGRDTDMGIGIELLSDITAQHADYIHAQWGACEARNDWEGQGTKPETIGFVDWWRYTFPEVILTDREIRDDTDIERRVNHLALKGLRSDVELYRCRRTIAVAPHYQAYLGKVNALRNRHADLLFKGAYRDTEGFTLDNEEIEARCFVRGHRMGVLLTQSHLESATTRLSAPGYRMVASDGVGDVVVGEANGDLSVAVGRHGLALVVFEKA